MKKDKSRILSKKEIIEMFNLGTDDVPQMPKSDNPSTRKENKDTMKNLLRLLADCKKEYKNAKGKKKKEIKKQMDFLEKTLVGMKINIES